MKVQILSQGYDFAIIGLACYKGHPLSEELKVFEVKVGAKNNQAKILLDFVKEASFDEKLYTGFNAFHGRLYEIAQMFEIPVFQLCPDKVIQIYYECYHSNKENLTQEEWNSIKHYF